MEGHADERVCVVAGATGAMGAEAARRMVKAGCDLALLDRDLPRLEALADELRTLGARALPVAVDLAEEADIDRAMAEVFDIFPVVHVLVNCAGISTFGPLLEMRIEDWDREQAVNCKATLLLALHVARNMIADGVRDGRVISVASQSGKRGELHHGSYCVSKAGVIMLTQVLGLELAEHGIAVTAVSPGMVDTPMLRGLFKDSGVEGEAFLEVGRTAIPMKRFARPGKVADLILFLASREAGYITGVTISIAGGTILN